MKSICGIDCSKCLPNETCAGCAATNGRPFGGECIVAECCHKKGYERCIKCSDSYCEFKEQLAAQFNALGIEDMEEVTSLNALKGSFVNLEYTLPNGHAVKFLDDSKIYLGNQVCKMNSDRCYGLCAGENYLLVCEYGDGGSDAEIVVFKKRQDKQ